MPSSTVRASRFEIRLAPLAVAIGFIAVNALAIAPAEAAYWGPFKKECVGDAMAKYAAVLQGVPPGQSWENTCARSAAVINGRRYANPARCVNIGAAMWGEFTVPDESCRRPRAQLQWGTFKDNGCVIFDSKGWGMRSYSSVLWGIPSGQSWEETCARTPANIAGKYFPHPTACVKADLKDTAQVLKTVAKLVARAAKHSKHPKLYLAAKGTALIATIVKAVNPALNIWGVFYVEDRNCPDFG